MFDILLCTKFLDSQPIGRADRFTHEGYESRIYMDAPVCVRATRTGRQDEHGCFRSRNEQVSAFRGSAPSGRVPQSTWKTFLRSFAIGLLSGLEGMMSRM